jgi:hypothetical protein
MKTMREARDRSENNNGEHQEVLVSFLLSRGSPSETTSAIGRIARSLTLSSGGLIEQ